MENKIKMKLEPYYEEKPRIGLWKLVFIADNEDDVKSLSNMVDCFELWNGKLRMCSLKFPCPYDKT
jgi:hypothetical protein